MISESEWVTDLVWPYMGHMWGFLKNPSLGAHANDSKTVTYISAHAVSCTKSQVEVGEIFRCMSLYIYQVPG